MKNLSAGPDGEIPRRVAPQNDTHRISIDNVLGRLRQTAVTRSFDRNVGTGGGDIQPKLDEVCFVGLIQPAQAFMETV